MKNLFKDLKEKKDDYKSILTSNYGESNKTRHWRFSDTKSSLDNLKDNEGSIIFRTEDNKEHIFKPNTLDLFIFPGDLWHKAVPTPNHKEKRIVYAGSLAFDVLNPPSRKKNIF